ncbi:MAG: hypothetical protein ACRDDH_04940 [Cetobacterium sp.]|uniref:hypothetical protein n=1 Tax=Cetobacterium sp. TaxID=2071632 RepID=UPI003EE81D2E
MLKSRFLSPYSIVSKLDNYTFKFFVEPSFFSRLLVSDHFGTFPKINSTNILLVDDSFLIFSFNYNLSDLSKGIYKNFLFPNLKLYNFNSLDSSNYILSMDYKNYEIPKENVEVILNDNQTFDINIKILNTDIK